jgi:hypothetical protein
MWLAFPAIPFELALLNVKLFNRAENELIISSAVYPVKCEANLTGKAENFFKNHAN